MRLAAVDFEGDRPLPEAEFLRALDLRAGRRVGPWDVLDAADGLRARLVEAGHLEAEVSAWLDGARARVSVSAGPRYDWRVEGFIMGDSQTPANWSANVRWSPVALTDTPKLAASRERHLVKPISAAFEVA